MSSVSRRIVSAVVSVLYQFPFLLSGRVSDVVLDDLARALLPRISLICHVRWNLRLIGLHGSAYVKRRRNGRDYWYLRCRGRDVYISPTVPVPDVDEFLRIGRLIESCQ